jgi:hypothetical protein
MWRLRPTFPTVRVRSLMKPSAFGFRIIELHIAIWQTGSHVDREKCLFFNLKKYGYQQIDFYSVDLVAAWWSDV